ncbi:MULTISPECIES: hypothetical protein [unclassified Achromobacter]|uniref:hypothetical protein n=1 Tax=unclassified Achromobacter TaxID=2626865 RepID=UPI000B51CD8F|nr:MULTISPECIES: hypothetical protein [unclassified Achromobacter]OWT73445.1 hypothetical protein CEY05_20175 [Achromobacter sp. HZ34]OWT79637.1 hypothetical protein CEY04_11805 [Achromobacter sp. HZ28]
MYTSALPRSLLRAGAITLLAALAGCANPDSAKPGTLLSDMEKQYGTPDSQCPAPGGGQRVVWSQQPEGSYAWGADIDANGRVVRVGQVLRTDFFSSIQPGWTPDQVRCVFGPPAKVRTAGLGDMNEIVWTYRYVEAQHWHMNFYVYMGAQGNAVTHYHSGPDDRYQRSE